MKWYEWVLVVVLVFFSNVLTAFLVKEFFFKIRTVDLLALGLYSTQDVYERLQRGEDSRKLQAELQEKSKKIEEYLARQRGIILIKQCVLSGNVEDITNEVANHLRTR